MRSSICNSLYSLYLDDEETISRVIEENSEGTPDLTFETDEEVKQNIWIIKDEEVLNKIYPVLADAARYIPKSFAANNV